ncbi:MAG: DUF4421 domain-containing protein [Chitinophagaceae bacterium]|nr:DUF4421 domain-containing protein [Chitinophagaceae bacterium]
MQPTNFCRHCRYTLFVRPVKYGTLICLALLACTTSNAQVAAKQPDSTFVEKLPQFLSLKWSQSTDNNALGVHSPGQIISLQPNASNASRIHLNYDFIGLAFRFKLGFLPGNNDEEIKGKTRGFGFDFAINRTHWLHELSYSGLKGYYLKNMGDFYPDWQKGDPYQQFPDLKITRYQGISSYKFNPNFSINALTNLTERQLKSTGTFMAHLLYQYYTSRNGAPLLTGGIRQSSNNFELLTGAGYYHTFVVGKQGYISLGASPLLGFVHSHIKTQTTQEQIAGNQANFIVRLNTRAGAGYNGNRFFTGVYFTGNISSMKQENTVVNTHESQVFVVAFAGYRLNAPEWLAKNVRAVKGIKPVRKK